MRSFLVACVAAIVLALGGAIVLDHFQKPAATAFTTAGVRM
jgi:hypothetical protein